ncbi:DUF1365 domain-containing protein [Micromonospora sp. 067-2]|uniref:DUF1365 domain-containing protein n=1 Tax=Micromonospora sp. 067-2 TaxID=2789270 RepID=UPI0039797833
MRAALYPCVVRHTRTAPLRHAFVYRTYQWLVDLDDLPRLPGPLAWLGRFEARDHLGDPNATIRANLDAFLARRGVLADGRVVMLTNARAFGHAFNPLSVYWCHDRSDRVVAVVAEVHNTYGERHCYLLTPDDDGHAETTKAFYVSPFFGTGGRYRMRLPEPGDGLALAITLYRDRVPVFVATLRGTRRAATTRVVLAAAARHPFVTLAVSARIRLQGIRLYLRGLPVAARTPHRPEEDTQ